MQRTKLVNAAPGDHSHALMFSKREPAYKLKIDIPGGGMQQWMLVRSMNLIQNWNCHAGPRLTGADEWALFQDWCLQWAMNLQSK
jgi:hypothetical protein